MKQMDAIILTLVIVGALNWALLGFFDFDLVQSLFGQGSWVSRILFAVVGLSGLWSLRFYSHISKQDQ